MRLSRSPPVFRSGFFYLTEFKLYGRRAPEDQYRHVEAAFLVIHIFNDAIEIIEGSVNNSNHFTRLKYRLGTGLINASLNPL